MEILLSRVKELIADLTGGTVSATNIFVRTLDSEDISEYASSRPSRVRRERVACELSVSFEATVAVKSATEQGMAELPLQIQDLRTLSALWSDHYPHVLGTDSNSIPPRLVMRYYPHPSLRDWVFERGASGQWLCAAIEEVLRFLVATLYSKEVHPTPPGFVVARHLERVRSRLARLSEKTDLLKRLVQADTITIGDKAHRNTPVLLESISRSPELLIRLTPPRVNMIHGDLELAHVLADKRENGRVREFILLDPRLPSGGSDIAYDIGKLWQSIRGRLDVIAFGQFSLGAVHGGDKALVIDEFQLDASSGDGALSDAERILPLRLAQMEGFAEDPNWFIRTEFSAAAHVAGAAPFYLTGDGVERVAMALHLRGVQLLTSFLERYT